MKYFKHMPEIEGFDTESYKGNILLLASSENYVEPKSFEEIVSFLWYNGKELNFFFNIQFDLAIILKPFLIDKEKKDLDDVLKYHTVKYGDFELAFAGNKGFHIQLGKRKKYFFDISPFYNDGTYQKLDTVAKAVLGEGKINEQLDIDRAKIGSENGYYRKNRKKIIEYCISDANLTKNISIKKVKSVSNTLGFTPCKWYSVASISKSYLDFHHKEEKWQFWKLVDGDITAFETIYNSYFGGLFLTKTLGNVKNVSKIDINSAYPDEIRNLKSIVGAKLKRVEKVSDCDYGFYKVKLKFNGLIPYRFKGRLLYPKSTKPVITYLTKLEYDFWIDKIPIEIIYGYQIYTTGLKSFNDYELLYSKRNKTKKIKTLDAQMEQWLYKIIMNASYGAMAESRTHFTYWSNFVYAAYITAGTRVKIYKEIFETIGKDNVISIMTDAIAYRDNGQTISESDELGKWKKEIDKQQVIFYMNGLYFSNNHLAKRGYARLDIADLVGGNTVKIKRTKVRKILEAIIQQKIKEIGDFLPEVKELHLLANQKRYTFPEKLLTFDHLNQDEVTGDELIINTDSGAKPYNPDNLKKIMYRERKARAGINAGERKQKMKNKGDI